MPYVFWLACEYQVFMMCSYFYCRIGRGLAQGKHGSVMMIGGKFDLCLGDVESRSDVAPKSNSVNSSTLVGPHLPRKRIECARMDALEARLGASRSTVRTKYQWLRIKTGVGNRPLIITNSMPFEGVTAHQNHVVNIVLTSSNTAYSVSDR